MGDSCANKKSQQASYAYFSNALDYDTFVVGATPAPNVTLAQLEQAVGAALQEFLSTPIDDAMLKRIKNQYLAQAIFDRDSLIGPAMILGHALVLGRTIDDVERYPQKINQVTEKHIAKAAQELLGGAIQPLTAWLQKQPWTAAFATLRPFAFFVFILMLVAPSRPAVASPLTIQGRHKQTQESTHG